MNKKPKLRSSRTIAMLVLMVILSTVFSFTHTHTYARSFKSPNYFTEQPLTTRDDIIARAKMWVGANVPYNQRGRYQGYREDCSGLVSMAWGLSIPGLTTYSLPTVSDQINKDELQPGDILNNQNGGGNPDFAHVLIFDSWVDSSHTYYNAYEEDPYWNGAHYTTNIPYPFWSGYDTSDYVPMRLKTLSNPPQPTTVLPTQPTTPTSIPGIEPFVGTWGVGGVDVLTINADGSAKYQARGENAQVQFTSVQGNTAYGTVASGTVIPLGPQGGNPIPTSGNITVTLTAPTSMQVSDGDLFCQPSNQCAY